MLTRKLMYAIKPYFIQPPNGRHRVALHRDSSFVQLRWTEELWWIFFVTLNWMEVTIAFSLFAVKPRQRQYSYSHTFGMKIRRHFWLVLSSERSLFALNAFRDSLKFNACWTFWDTKQLTDSQHKCIPSVHVSQCHTHLMRRLILAHSISYSIHQAWWVTTSVVNRYTQTLSPGEGQDRDKNPLLHTSTVRSWLHLKHGACAEFTVMNTRFSR